MKIHFYHVSLITLLCASSVLLTQCGGDTPDAIAPVPEIAAPPPPPDLDGDGIPDDQDDDRDGDNVKNVDEISRGSNPDDPDTDHDKINDGVDNCPLIANHDQHDANTNTIGDACEDDDDSDGLTDQQEKTVYGTDPLNPDTDGDGWNDGYEVQVTHTSPTRADSDSDGVNDPQDAFPLDNAESRDSDSDGIGDHRDNCPLTPNPDQTNTDLAYQKSGVKTPSDVIATGDALGDACDDDLDGDGRAAIYVDANHGNDQALGTFAAPVQTLARALQLATTRPTDSLELTIGKYTTENVMWPKVLTVSGGWDATFHTQTAPIVTTLQNGKLVPDFVLADPAQNTALSNFSSAPTIALLAGEHLVLKSLAIRHDGSGPQTLQLRNKSDLTFEQGQILAARKMAYATAIDMEDSTLTLRDVYIDAESDTVREERIGILATGSTLTLQRTELVMTDAKMLYGLMITDVTGTIEAAKILLIHKDAQFASAVVYAGVSPSISQTTLITMGATDQAPLLCAAEHTPSPQWSDLQLATVGGQAPQPFLIDCDGTHVNAAQLSELCTNCSAEDVTDISKFLF